MKNRLKCKIGFKTGRCKMVLKISVPFTQGAQRSAAECQKCKIGIKTGRCKMVVKISVPFTQGAQRSAAECEKYKIENWSRLQLRSRLRLRLRLQLHLQLQLRWPSRSGRVLCCLMLFCQACGTTKITLVAAHWVAVGGQK